MRVLLLMNAVIIGMNTILDIYKIVRGGLKTQVGQVKSARHSDLFAAASRSPA